jgi:hypothetical protein
MEEFPRVSLTALKDLHRLLADTIGSQERGPDEPKTTDTDERSDLSVSSSLSVTEVEGSLGRNEKKNNQTNFSDAKRESGESHERKR